ncbi:MAG: serine/threonine-protein kinase, partial [Calditrichia bacterium]
MNKKEIGNFKIIREIGRGGIGIVYLAEDLRLKRLVALKFLKDNVRNKSELLQEARMASSFNHPGIVTIYDIVEEEDSAFIVMEYVEGDSLDHFIQTHHLEFPFALRLAREICEITAAAHQYHLIHGDIKPRNIIITPEGSPRLVDFGLAVSVASEEGKQFSGSFSYLAPEQLSGAEKSEQSDIYSLGIIFYQLFTNRLPFPSDHEAARIFAAMQKAPENPCLINKKLPQSICSIIMRCLEKKPADRYGSSKTLLSHLRNVSSVEVKENVLHPSKILIAALLFLIVILTSVYLLNRFTRNPGIQYTTLEEITLPQQTRVTVSNFTNRSQSAELQSRGMALSAILREQLQSVPGILLKSGGEEQQTTQPQ